MYHLNTALLRKFIVKEDKDYLNNLPKSSNFHHILQNLLLQKKRWADIRHFYKNKGFHDLETLKFWLHNFVVDNLNKENIKSITHNSFYNKQFNAHFEI